MPGVLDLPMDIQTYIASYIVRQEDLRNLYLTCKGLYHVAIARGYHSIVIGEHCGMWALTGMLHPKNEGLQHIRHVTFETCGDDDHDCDASDSDNLHIMFAQLLPKNILLTLTYDGPDSFPVRVLNVLHERQPRLRCMRISTNTVPDKIKQWRSTGTSAITTIQLVISSCLERDAWRSAFEQLPRLKNLELVVNATAYESDVRKKSDKPPTSADLGLQLVVALFGVHTTHLSKRLELQSLQVKGLDLATAAQPLLQAVDHTQLLALGLQKCRNATAVLQTLDPKTRVGGLKLRSLVITEDADTRSTEQSSSFNDFLGSFGSLEYLVIEGHPNTFWPDFMQLLPHATTLRFLYLDVDGLAEPTTKEGRIKDLSITSFALSECVRLESLALPYSVWVQGALELGLDMDKQRFRSALAALPVIRSLRLLDYADYPAPGSSEEGDHEAIALHDLQSIATNVFTTIPKLEALSFFAAGEQPWYYDINGPFVPPYYARGRVISSRGKETILALATTLEELIDSEPCSEILTMEIKPSSLLRYCYKP